MPTAGPIDGAYQNTAIDHTCSGNCSGCGECCSDVLPLSEKEINRIREYIQRKHIKAYRNAAAVVTADLTCPFRDAEARICRIYDVRPEICRAFICNQSPEQMAQNKKLFTARRKQVLMRHEFYGDEQDVKAWAMLTALRMRKRTG